MALDMTEVNALVGKESGLVLARHKANISDIRHWSEVIRQDNRTYREFENKTETAPPAMLMVWAMPPLWCSEPKVATEPHELAIKALKDAGYDTGLGIGLEQKFFQPLKVGDRLSYKIKLSAVSEGEIETAVGPGYQLDLCYTFQNQDGAVVSEQIYSLAQVAKIKARH